MTEKTEEQIAKEKAAVAAMRNAQGNMTTVLERVASLEAALRTAAGKLEAAAKHIPDTAYEYKGDRRLRDYVLDHAADARRALG